MEKIWRAYIGIGIGAFIISFCLESKVFLSITANVFFALSITAVLESCKVCTIIFQSALDANNHNVPRSLQTANVFFKIALVFLSVLCSLAIISKSLDRPNLESIKAKELTLAENLYSKKTSELKTRYDKSLEDIPNQIRERYSERYEELKNHYGPRIEKEEQLRDAEFKNVVNGVRKGPNWNEHNRLLEELNQKYDDEKNKLQKAEDKELKTYLNNIESDYKANSSELENNHEQELRTLSKKDYLDDERVKNPLISSLLLTLKEFLGIEFSYPGFTVSFSLLISILLEGVIFISFTYIVLYWEKIMNPKDNGMVLNFEQAPENEMSGFAFTDGKATATPSGFNNNHAESLFRELFQGQGQTFGPEESGFNPDKDNFDPCSDR